jgi:hypothetical protein
VDFQPSSPAPSKAKAQMPLVLRRVSAGTPGRLRREGGERVIGRIFRSSAPQDRPWTLKSGPFPALFPGRPKLLQRFAGGVGPPAILLVQVLELLFGDVLGGASRLCAPRTAMISSDSLTCSAKVSRFCVFWIRNTMRNVMIVVEVLITNCQVSL